MKQVPDKGLIYQYEQSVLLRLTSQSTGNVPLKQNQRAFFDNRSVIKGNKVVAISIPSMPGGTSWLYEDINILPDITNPLFALTLIDTNGNVAVNNYPISDLNLSNNRGVTRRFNTTISFRDSYVLLLAPSVIIANSALMFNFFTID